MAKHLQRAASDRTCGRTTRRPKGWPPERRAQAVLQAFSRIEDSALSSASLLGQRVKRVEDEPLLRGRGRFVDDIRLPELLHAAFFRSPHAHARLKRVDVTAARALAGVRAVFTYDDLRPHLTCDRIPLALPSAAIRFQVDPYPLARDELTYVGEPIALVDRREPRVAEDALRLIEIDADPLPAVTDPVAGLAPGSPRARLDCPDNLVAQHVIKYGDIDDAFARAAHRIAMRFKLDKGGGHSLETRAVLARFDPAESALTVWANTQMPHRAKSVLVKALGLDETRVRVIAPDVGGAFGPKAVFHPEELVIPAASRALNAPIKWIEDRVENFTATVLERDQDWDMEAAFDADGRLLGIRGHMRHDHGANTPYGVALPYNAATNMIGPYVLPSCHLTVSLCLTNLTPAAPTRGAGRPQGMFVMERLLDTMADKLALTRDEIRRRNLIPRAQMPYSTQVAQRDGSTMVYDSGDYPECQRRALEAAGWNDFAARRDAARMRGRTIGIGLCNYVEGTGRGPFESASIRVHPSGRIVIATGATAQGQGVKTTLAQIASGILSVAGGLDSGDRRRHAGIATRPRRVCEPSGRHGGQRRPSGRAGRVREGDRRGLRDAARTGGGIGIARRQGARARHAGRRALVGRDRGRADGRSRHGAARQSRAGARRVRRLSAPGDGLQQRHACVRSRGRHRDRTCRHHALCRRP